MNINESYRVVQINTVYPYGSTGKIAKGIHDACQDVGATCITAYRYHEDKRQIPEDSIAVSSWWDCHIHNRLVKYTLLQGCFSHIRTASFLKKVSDCKPDVIHFHNLHGSYINLPMLFRYVKKNNTPVVWTLHDCWSFTGWCPYFTMTKCEKWKSGCGNCPQIREYPRAYIDLTHRMWELKKKWFTSVDNMVIVTPSQWLADIAQESYLRKYPVKVINNGINLDIFQPVDSDFRKKHHCEGKKIVLGVAFGWGVRKGLDVFVKLAQRLPEDYQIVLVGTDDKSNNQLPKNIISIHRTQNQHELAEIYSAADVFANPTREENFPTVNIEALACGTPIVTFETGGSPEIIDETCGLVVPCDDVEAMGREIRRVCEEKPFTREACVQRARKFDMWKKFGEYVELYREIVDKQ